jgi:hypothetical protein
MMEDAELVRSSVGLMKTLLGVMLDAWDENDIYGWLRYRC